MDFRLAADLVSVTTKKSIRSRRAFPVPQQLQSDSIAALFLLQVKEELFLGVPESVVQPRCTENCKALTTLSFSWNRQDEQL